MTLPLIKEKGLLHLNGITSGKIISILEKKHSKDVFVPECKNGETWGARDLLKLDAWVLVRTYSPLITIGYEIKCSRADFEADQKWTSYLDLCHQFYFVCPAGLIRATDLPSNIGLIWASKDKLHTKHKAERRQPDIEKMNRLLIYVLMSRSKIVADMNAVHAPDPKTRLEYIRDSIADATARKELSYIVKGHIREVSEALHKKESKLTFREQDMKRFEKQLAKLGITWNSDSHNWQDTEKVSQSIDKLKATLDNWTLRNMGEVGSRMKALADELLEKT